MMEVKIMTSNHRILIRSPFALKDVLKGILGRYWDKVERAWCYPATPFMAGELTTVLRAAGVSMEPDEKFLWLLSQMLIPEETKHYSTKTPCFEHQARGLDMIVRRPGTYLAWEMGTGKTKTVIDAAEVLEMKKVLVVCPKSVVGNWPTQWRRHGDESRTLLHLGTGPVNKRATRLSRAIELGRPFTAIINYEAAWRPPMNKVIFGTDWDMVVCDEIHRIKDERGRASKFMYGLRAKAGKTVGLSGTPMPNNPMDLFAQLRFIDPGVFGTNYVGFRLRYAILGGFQDKNVVAFRNQDDMNRRFFSVADRVEKEEVLDLPPVTHEMITVELGKEARKVYDDIKTSFVARFKSGEIRISNALVELLRLQQITGGMVCIETPDGGKENHEVDWAKAEALLDLFRDLPKNEPVVVFTKFRHDMEVVHEVARKAGRESAELSGSKNEIMAWQAEPGITVLGAQIRAGGLGVDMTRARYCVMYSLGFSLGDYEQALARVDRQGQTRKVEYFHLIARDTVDEVVYRALTKKAKVVDEVLKETVR